MAREAFNTGEVWNPVCCHGNITVRLNCGALNLIAKNEIFIIQIGWDMFMCLIKIWLRVLRHHLANLHLLKTCISLEQRYLKIVNSIFLFIYIYCYNVLKWRRYQTCDFRHSTTLIFIYSPPSALCVFGCSISMRDSPAPSSTNS